MVRTVARLVVTALAISTLPAMACAQSSPSASESTTAASQAAPAKRASVMACDLLTAEEIQGAAGWPVVQTVPTHNPGPPALSICNFMGKDLTRMVAVWYGEGSGGRYKSSAEMAKALGTRDGMLVKPAQPLDDLGLPATREDQQGGLVHVHGIASDGDELTVAASAFDTARALFVKAVARLTARRR
jgi:hypothetical protein